MPTTAFHSFIHSTHSMLCVRCAGTKLLNSAILTIIRQRPLLSLPRQSDNTTSLTVSIPFRSSVSSSTNELAKMADEKTYTFQDVAEHNTKKDLFMVIHDKVYDATKFVDEHP